MKPHSTRLLGCPDPRNPDEVILVGGVFFHYESEARGGGSTFVLSNPKPGSQNVFPNQIIPYCGVVFILVSLEHFLGRIAIVPGRVVRAKISGKQRVSESFEPRTKSPINDGISCAFIRKLCLYWFECFIWRATAGSRIILSMIHHPVGMRMCQEPA